MDSQLARVLEHLPVLDTSDIDKIRALNESSPMPAPADVDVDISERFLPGPPGAPQVRVRVYRPADTPAPLPALHYFHPGLTFGTIEMDHARCLRFAAEVEAVVVSVDYRRAPEDPFPRGVEDCYHSVDWCGRNPEALGIDPDRMAVVGCSTGATLAAAVALMARDRGGPRLAFQMLLQPCVDDRLDTPSMRQYDKPDRCEAGREGSAHTWRYYLGEVSQVPPYAAPARAQTLRGLPPTYISTAERDCLRDEGILYASRLMGDGVPTELHHFPGTFHAFDLVVRTAAISRRALQEQIDTLARALSAGSTGSRRRSRLGGSVVRPSPLD